MSDDALIRLINLKATGVTAKQLEAKKIGRYSYCRDLLVGKKSFGEKIARKIEESFGWPRGCLDTDGGCEAIHGQPAKILPPFESIEPDNASGQRIPTKMIYTPSNLNSAILLMASLLGALDDRSRRMIGDLLQELPLKLDEAQDIANKASALATVQKAIARNKALNKALTTQGAPETVRSDLEPKK